MRLIRRSGAAIVVLTLAAGPASAQGNAQCNAYGEGVFANVQAKNVCNAAVDGASLFMPVAGILITGGNPFLGATGGLGGLPHLGLTLRANGTELIIPDFNYNGNGTVVGQQQKVFAPAPLVEGALGIFGGTGRSRSLALDALGSAQLLPTTLIKDVRIDVHATRIGSVALGIGWGGRLTLIGDHGGMPAVTVSVMRRNLPRIGYGDVKASDRYEFISDLHSTEYRATIGKRVGPLDLGAGGGWTDYRAAAEIVFLNPVTDVQEPTINLDLKDSRRVLFLNGGLAAGVFYLIGEAGWQRGKDLQLVTTFTGNDPQATRFFASIGLRVGI
jgi:hypothetical protein